MSTRKPEHLSEPLPPDSRWADSCNDALLVAEVEPARPQSIRAALEWVIRGPETLENRRTPRQRQGLCAAASSGKCSKPA
jgi:hypothetical protein